MTKVLHLIDFLPWLGEAETEGEIREPAIRATALSQPLSHLLQKK